jgi:cell division protein FtsL
MEKSQAAIWRKIALAIILLVIAPLSIPAQDKGYQVQDKTAQSEDKAAQAKDKENKTEDKEGKKKRTWFQFIKNKKWYQFQG